MRRTSIAGWQPDSASRNERCPCKAVGKRGLRVIWACLLLGAWSMAGQAGLAHSPVSAKESDAILHAADAADFAPATEEAIPFFGGLCPLEKRFFQDAADGTLERFSLLDAALIAGGVERPAQLKRYQEKLSALVKELRASGKVTGSPRCRAEAIFEFMHRRVLGSGYRLECTDLRTAIDSGQFNCISATVLFNCLAGEFNLEVCGLEIPGHAVSRVFLPDGSLDIETTCPGWFRLMHDPARQAKALAGTIGRVPNRDMSHARQVFAVQIAAMIYYNRGVDLLGQKLFAEAAAANAKALHLDPISTTARGNLLAVLNNWAIELGANGHHTEAVDLLRIGMAFDQDYEPFSLNYVHVHHQWVEDLCRQGQFEEALTVLAAASQQFPGSDYFRLAPSDVRRRWAAGSSIRAAEDRQ